MKGLFTIISICMVLRSALLADAGALYEMVLPNPFVISPEKVEQITHSYGLSKEELLKKLIPLAKSFAKTPVSHYNVGVVALGKSGTIYLGVNLEFPGFPLNQTVHGEQFLVANALQHGETEFAAIAISAAPCGHCRQFLNEMCGNDDMKILIPDSSPETIASLLPQAFGLRENTEGSHVHCTDHPSLLLQKALQAAADSYAPHTQAKSGVAIQTKDGQIYGGPYIENAAYNPSLSPLQSALVALVADVREYSEIQKVVLAEQLGAKISQELLTREILKTIAPEAEFSLVELDVSMNS